jgi:hypothetical protein
VIVSVVIFLIDVEARASWVATLLVEAVAIIRAAEEVVVTCGHEVTHGTGITSPEKSQLTSGSSSSSEPTGPEIETTVSQSQVDHIWYPGRSGYALTKALTEAVSLGGSKLNLKGTGWKTKGTCWLVDCGEVASEMECVVISGARLRPDKSLAKVLASPVRLGLAFCWEATPVVVSGARITPDMSPVGVLVSSTRSGPTAIEVLPLHGHGCPVYVSSGEEGGGVDPAVPLPPRGDVVIEFVSPGEPTTVVVVVLRGKEYHVVAAIAGHELKTPKAEHRPGLKRLLKIVHLELNGKVLSTRSVPLPGVPTVGVSDPGDPQPDRLVNFVSRAPVQMG